MNALTAVTLDPSGFVTTTFTVPAAWVGVLTVTPVSELERLTAGTPPNVAVAPGANPDPLMVTKVPPPVFPVTVESVVISGKAYWNPLTLVIAVPSGFVTTTLTLPTA